MALIDLFNQANDPEKYGRRPPPPPAAAVPQMDVATAGLMQALPRGVPLQRDKGNREQKAHWASPLAMGGLTMGEQHAPGQLPLLPMGSFNGRPIGYNDDRLQITIAGARAGKTSTLLIPELLTYPGSMFVNDPKGELAIKTARHRAEVLKQNVVILDGFGITGIKSGCYNPLDELDLQSPRVIDDAGSLAQAIVVADGSSNDNQFWTEGGRELLKGVILSVLQLPREHRHFITVRELLTGAHPWLRHAAAQREFRTDAERAAYMENLLLTEMAKASEADITTPKAVVKVITGIGEMYSTMPSRMRGSMLASARVATSFLDSLAMQSILTESHFTMRELRDAKTTVYLVLPPGNETKHHFRWLRIMFDMAGSRMMRMGEYPRDEAPVIFLMEEFPVLGYLETIEQAAAFLPSFGVKLHIVAQSLTLIQLHYPKTWPTFFNCAGVSQFFANTDDVTLDYISKRLGNLTFDRHKSQFSDKNEDNRTTLPLLSPFEIERYFAREYNNMIVFIPGQSPYAVQRMTHDEVQHLRTNMEQGRIALDAQPLQGVPHIDPAEIRAEVKRRRGRPSSGGGDPQPAEA